jgi:hypothetical protein
VLAQSAAWSVPIVTSETIIKSKKHHFISRLDYYRRTKSASESLSFMAVFEISHCATNQNVAGSIPNGVFGIFH